MKTTKKIMGAVMALAMVSALAPMSAFAETKETDVSLTKEPTVDELYLVTIPATLTVDNSGWNALGTGIKVEKAPKAGTTDTFLDFDPAKKVTITATSANEWKLKSDETTKTVGYTLKSASTDTAAVTTWDFLANEITQDGTTKTAGIDVNADDYDAAPAGTYTDKITFTISVEDAAYVPKTFTSLSDGDILRVGDTLEVASGGYNFPDDGCRLMSWNAPFTVLRANVEGIGDPSMMPAVTEDANGTYYVIKDNENDYFAFSGKLVATDTSDGVIITKNGSNWAINVYEP